MYFIRVAYFAKSKVIIYLYHLTRQHLFTSNDIKRIFFSITGDKQVSIVWHLILEVLRNELLTNER